MINSHPRVSAPSLLTALAIALVCVQSTFAQEAPKQSPAAAAPAESAAATKNETASAPAKEAQGATESAPSSAAAEPCATETAAPTPARESLAPQRPQFFEASHAMAAAPPPSRPAELFPRAAVRYEAAAGGWQQQPAATYTPLTPEQKMKRAARNAFFSPIGVGRTLVSSIITQWNEDSQPHKDTEDEVADGASRFAINYSRRATRTLLGSGVYAVLFRQDPRYDRAEEGKGLAARAGHAISRVFVQRGDSGNLQPAVSRWAGSLSASALSNLWERSTPGHDRIGADATFKRFANSFINDSINNLFTEFWPDIRKIFGK